VERGRRQALQWRVRLCGGCPSSGLVEAALRSAAGGQADAQSTAAAAQCTAVAPVDEKETVP
jgi:hypothetical protein